MESNTERKPVEFLVVDSSALIRRAPLKDLTNTAYSTNGVVNEIRDAATRASLQVLPFDFKLKEPSSDAIRFVNGFSKKTGDFANLSAVDLHLLALTYQLSKENLAPEEFAKLRTEPVKNIPLSPEANLVKLKLEKTVNIAGFYAPDVKKKNDGAKSADDLVESVDKLDLDKSGADCAAELPREVSESSSVDKSADENNNNNNGGNNEERESSEEGDDENDSDEEGWIKPSNLAEIKKRSIVESEQQDLTDLNLKVACMTSDFAMQNVLIQIGIPILSVDGLLIKKPRSYVLKCFSCAKVTTNMGKEFCPFCGYKTLERVVVTVDADGNKVYRGRRKPRTSKGLRFSLPMPRGGKHSDFPILSEDQPRAQNLPSKKALAKNNPLDPDYTCQSSPFVTKDVYSRASALGIKATNARNSANRFNKRS